MSDWKERLEAVATLANRPRPMDGEVYCANRTCGNRRLNRTDLTCWVCGADKFIPASEEMLASNRFTFVKPPRREESAPKPAVQTSPQVSQAWQKYFASPGSVLYPPQTALPAQATAAPQTYADVLKQYQHEYEKAYQRAAQRIAPVVGVAPATDEEHVIRAGETVTVRIDPDPPKRSFVDRFWGRFGL